jgi:hypothetical protein
MAQMTLGDLRDQVHDYIPNKPDGQIARAANMILREMTREIGPVERGTLSASGPTEASDGAISVGSTTYASAGASFSSANEKDALIKSDGSDIWFTIVSVPSATSLTLSSVWQNSASVSSLGYQIVYPVIEFPEDVMEILEIARYGRYPIQRVGGERIYADGYIQPGEPLTYVQRGAGTNGRLRIQFGQPPYEDMQFMYLYRKAPQYYDANDDCTVTDFPSIYDDALFFGTMHLLWDQEDAQDRSAYWLGKFNRALEQVVGQDAAHAGGQIHIARIGARLGHRFARQTLPVT